MRARNLKPGFFKNETLAELPPLARLLFEGLWCLADRVGRLEDRPKRIKAEVLPYDSADVNRLLDELQKAGFIQRYSQNEAAYIQVVNFQKHQNPHVREAESSIPAPGGYCAEHQPGTVPGTSPARLTPDSPFSDSGFLTPDSSIPKEEAAAVAREILVDNGGGGIQEEHQEDDPLLWDLWEVPGWPRDDALDRKELAGAKRDYPRANLSEVIADLRAEAPLKHPRKALRAFAKQAHERAPAERPTPSVLPAVPELTPELRKAQVLAAAKARRQVEAMAAGIRGVT